MTQPNIYPGWLPYGSNDDSVVLRLPLTEDFVAADANCSFITYAGTGVDDGGVGLGRATFDSERGMLAYNPTGTLSYRLVGLTRRAELDAGGQVSFQVPRDWLSSNESDSTGWSNSGSTETAIGPAQGGNEPLFSRSSVRLSGSLGGGFYNINRWSGATSQTQRIHSVGKDEYVTINVGWGSGIIGGHVILAVDGLPCMRSNRNNGSYANKWNRLWLGSMDGAGFMGSVYGGLAYLRNLQISSRAPIFPVHPTLGKCVMFGDSLVQDMATNAPNMDNNPAFAIIRPLAKKGLLPGEFVTQTHGGHQVAQTGSMELYGELPGLLSENPTTVFLRAGSNDTDSDSETSAFDADFKDMIEVILGLNSNPETSVQKLIIGTVPSRRATLVNPTYDAGADPARVAAVNGDINAIPAWIEATHPSRHGDVAIADCYTRMGAETPGQAVFLGQLGDGLDYPGDIHPGPGGNFLAGLAYADALLRVLS